MHKYLKVNVIEKKVNKMQASNVGDTVDALLQSGLILKYNCKNISYLLTEEHLYLKMYYEIPDL